MNRKERRAKLKSGQLAGGGSRPAPNAGLPIDGLMAQAGYLFQRGQTDQAQAICDNVLTREPAQVNALNLLGLIHQASSRHKLAVKMLSKAVASDPFNAACHYDLACSLQALGRNNEAEAEFKQAIVFGAKVKPPEDIVLRSAAISACIDKIEASWPLPVKPDELFTPASLQAIAGDLYLCCALATVPLHRATIEKFLTALRAALLRPVAGDMAASDDATARLVCAVAQQCFINEYVFAQSDAETRHALELRDELLQILTKGKTVSPMLLAAVAAYFPLHTLPPARQLLDRQWPDFAAEVIRQQVREPLEEIGERASIPSLTSVDDTVSLQVMQQYEENPYPRWTINPLLHGGILTGRDDPEAEEILIAGCGSGQHVFEVVKRYPRARVLAIDISLPSLAYARRKTREAKLSNIDYAQADILKLGTIGRSFDRIESIGVLHHLADPEAGWRVLASLLRPRGEMHIGLYSETGRAGITAMRAAIAERGYWPTAEDIRRCRQDILRDANTARWRRATEASDFYSVSGCRDLLFHVMEHRFTIPRIKTFLDEQKLSFAGFHIDPQAIERFLARFPGLETLTDLDKWQAYEADNPQTFRRMYVFTARKD
jgi:SAM-dependent methyltransferase/tetratricopeptide (TPR) repeat protein